MNVGPFELRSHQIRAIDGLRAAIRAGKRRIILQAPCGFGKTIVSSAIVQGVLEKRNTVLFLASGRQLIYQKSSKLTACGIPHAVLMAGEDYDRHQLAIVSSKDTLWSRAFKNSWLDVPDSNVVLIDEAHLASGESWQAIYQKYPTSILIGFTATPAAGNGKPLPGWDAMVSGGTYQELIAGGFLVPARVWAPFMVDMSGVDVNRENGEFNQSQMAQRYDDKVLVGDLIESWRKYAEDRLTAFFASSVRASIAASEEFTKAGIPAVHIDADTEQHDREDVFRMARSGDIRVICNYGVLRVGVDLPEVQCVQLAVSMNSLNTYLQTVGRGFRTHPGKKDCVIIDHGGNVHKHGWPTEDHEWSITDERTVQERDKEKAEREKKPKEPLVCPECGAAREKGPVCHVCGHQHKRTGLKVRTVNGELKELTQKKVRKKKEQTDLQKTWMTCVSIFASKGGTFRQAEWLFHKKTGQWPPDTVGPRPPEHQRGLRVRDIYPNWGRRR